MLSFIEHDLFTFIFTLVPIVAWFAGTFIVFSTLLSISICAYSASAIIEASRRRPVFSTRQVQHITASAHPSSVAFTGITIHFVYAVSIHTRMVSAVINVYGTINYVNVGPTTWLLQLDQTLSLLGLTAGSGYFHV